MKKTFLKTFAALSLSLCVHHYASAAPACLVNRLSITTGEYNATTLTYGTPTSPAPEPNWYIAARSSVYTGSPLLFGNNAEIVRPLYDHTTGNPVWSVMNPGVWISDRQANADPGIVVAGNTSITFERRFSTCGAGQLTFDLDIINDNYVSSVSVDGTLISGWSQPAVLNYHNYIAPTADLHNAPFTLTLPSGPHTIQIVVQNFPLTGSQANDKNPIGLNVTGSISASSAILLNDQSPTACNGFVCSDNSGGCDDLCYWKLQGNSITASNFLGTTNNDDIRFKTFGVQRAVIKGSPTGLNDDPKAGFMGVNTGVPTARFHVNCSNGNVQGSGTSDVRFENLETGTGAVLAIDANGYVYNSGIPAGQAQGMMQKQIDDLKAEVASLKANAASTSIKSDASAPQNILYQNTPNPFDHETTIEFNIVKMEHNAFIVIYDLNGRELTKYPVTSMGKGKVIVSGEELQPGMYLYSLVVDGMENSTKRMVLSK